MTQNMKPVLWVSDVIAFIKCSIPKLDRSDDWHHKHITAYQIGCEALSREACQCVREIGLTGGQLATVA